MAIWIARLAVVATLVSTFFGAKFCAAAQQTLPIAPREELLADYDATAELWQAIVSKNPDLAPAEVFVRTLVAEIRLTKKVPRFADEFVELVTEKKPFGCTTMKLCQQKLTPAFRIAQPLGVTDIMQYVLESTCFGFIPDVDNKLRVLQIFERVARRVGFGQLPLTVADKLYLRRDFADALTYGNRIKRAPYQFTKLRQWAEYADVRPNFKLSRGAYRPLDPVVEAASREACR